MKKTNYKIKIIFLTLFAFIMLLCGATPIINTQIAKATNEDIATVDYNAYTDYDTLKQTTNLTIQDYVEENLVGTRGGIVGGSSVSFQNAGQDDLITEIIPKELFFTEGVYSHVGQEYGFYINTKLTSDYYYSTVFVYDIDANLSMLDNNNAIYTLKPIIDRAYIGLLKEKSSFYSHTRLINYQSSVDFVIPSPTNIYVNSEGDMVVEYGMLYNYYLKDVAFGASLYNEKALNHGDEGYDPYNDYGSFFVGVNYEYTAVSYTPPSYSDYLPYLQLLIKYAEYLPVVGNYIEDIGSIFSVLSDVNQTVQFISSPPETNGDLEIFEEKITGIFHYNNRDEQLAHFKDANGNPYLIKTAALLANAGENNYWYGVGDSVSAYFNVNHSALNEQIPEYTRITNHIVAKIVEKDTASVIDVHSIILTDHIHNETYTELSPDTAQDVYILPDGKNVFRFVPNVSNNFWFDTEANLPYNVYSSYDLTTHTGTKIGDSTSAVALTADQIYYIELDNSTNYLITDELVSNIDAPQLIVGTNSVIEEQAYGIENNKNEWYYITSDNPNAVIIVYDESFMAVAEQTGAVALEKAADEYLYVKVDLPTGVSTANLTVETRKTVNFVTEDSSITSLSIVNDVCPTLPVPSVGEDYEFVGWFLDQTFTGDPITESFLSTYNQATITLYEKVQLRPDAEVSYTIQYIMPTVLATGEAIDQPLVLENAVYSYNGEIDVELPTLLENDYYVLEGWYLDSGFENQLTYFPSGTTGDKIIYAKIIWKPYQLTFKRTDNTTYTTITARYNETIVLPTMEQEGRIGSWLIADGDNWVNTWMETSFVFEGNFGENYVVTDNKEFKVDWKYVYVINFQNITYDGLRASLYDTTYYDFVPEYYVQGKSYNLDDVVASLNINYGAYEPKLVFIGWYTDKNFGTTFSRIEASSMGVVTVCAKWRMDFTFGERQGQREVAYKDPTSQASDQIYVGLAQNGLYDKLQELGITKIYIKYKIRLWEKDNGKQNIYLYNGSTQIGHHTYDVNVKSPIVKENVFSINLSTIGETDYLYFRYKASAILFHLHWYNNFIYYEISYVHNNDDMAEPSFYWSDFAPI